MGTLFLLFMTRNSNQNIEKHYFEMFRQVYPLPSGAVTHGDKPDIIIEGQKLIGIEMTNFYLEEGSLSASEQVQRKLREKIVSDAQKLYQNDNERNFEITFGFDKANPIRDKKKLEKKLVDLAKRIEDLGTGSISRDNFRTIPELFHVYLNANEYQDARWRVVTVYDGQVMSRDRLLKIVRAKEKKANRYKKCDAYWLLVVVDFFDRAQDQEIRVVDLGKIESDIFEKIIVFKTVFGEVLEVI